MVRAATLVGFALVLQWAAPASAQPIVNEQLPALEADQGASGMAGPTSTAGTALEGKSYIVRVRGAYGAYDSRLMRLQGPSAIGWQLCGQRVNARGQDAEFIWGLPLLTGRSCPALPLRHENLVIDAGSGFADYEPVATEPQPTHLANSNRYEYLVQRTGGEGPISVGLLDSGLSDNIGELRARVRRLRPRDCNNGAWVFFGAAFASEAECLEQNP